MITREKCSWGFILNVTTTKYIRLDYTRKNYALLHLFHTTTYNSMHEKKQQFLLISYTRDQIYYKKSYLAPIINLSILVRIHIKSHFLTQTYINTCSIPICPLCSHFLVYSKNHLFILVIVPIFDKEL